MVKSSDLVSLFLCLLFLNAFIFFSLGYKGKDVPGEVRALKINTAYPKQVHIYVYVCVCVCIVHVCVFCVEIQREKSEKERERERGRGSGRGYI